MKRETQPSDVVRSPSGVLYRVVSATPNFILLQRLEYAPKVLRTRTVTPDEFLNFEIEEDE